MTPTAKLGVATSVLSLFLGMLIGTLATEEKFKNDIPNYVIYVPKETTEKVELRNTLMDAYQLDITKADWLADNINVASKIYGIPTLKLVALISIESEFVHDAISSADAVGFTQVIPSVWGDEIPYDVYNPAENILAGAYVLSHYKTKCGDWDCALKAYNIGITNYNKGRNVSAAKRYLAKFKKELKKIEVVLLGNNNLT